MALAALVAVGTATVRILAVPQPGSLRLEVANLFVELNDTDRDLGLHAEIDGGAWTSLKASGPGDTPLLAVTGRGPLRRQGLTQLAFESAEPPLDEQPPEVFFGRFPEGRYEIEGTAQDGGEFENTVTLSHVLAAPPEATVSGLPPAESCDATDLPEVFAPVIIDWDPVTASHPTIGRSGRVRIARYQFFVEQGDLKLSVDLPPTVTVFEIPASITARGGVFKYEIIARTQTGNNTAVESCFRMK
jgi:hypothetical protein